MPRAEVLTMTKQGLADFLLELKRAKLRHQTPLAKFVAFNLKPSRRKLDRKQASKLKTFLESKEFQQDCYAKFIDGRVAEWEAPQQKAADKVRTAAPPQDSEDIVAVAISGERGAVERAARP